MREGSGERGAVRRGGENGTDTVRNRGKRRVVVSEKSQLGPNITVSVYGEKGIR